MSDTDVVGYRDDGTPIYQSDVQDPDLQGISDLNAALDNYTTVIAVRKENGEPVIQYWLDGRYKLRCFLAGKLFTEGHASDEVFGHPNATIMDDTYKTLIPVQAADKDTIERHMTQTQAHIDRLQKKIGEANHMARIKAYDSKTRSIKRKAEKYLDSGEHMDDCTIRDLLRDVTMQELVRLSQLDYATTAVPPCDNNTMAKLAKSLRALATMIESHPVFYACHGDVDGWSIWYDRIIRGFKLHISYEIQYPPTKHRPQGSSRTAYWKGYQSASITKCVEAAILDLPSQSPTKASRDPHEYKNVDGLTYEHDPIPYHEDMRTHEHEERLLAEEEAI